MQEKLFGIVAEALELGNAELRLEDNLRDYEGWDSLAQLSLIAALDDQFGVIITAKEFQNLLSLSDLLAHVQANSTVE